MKILIIDRLDRENFLAYEIKGNTYKIIELNTRNIISILIGKIKDYNLYFKGFSKVEYASILLKINEYNKDNNFNINNKCKVINNNFSISEFIKRNKLTRTNFQKSLLIIPVDILNYIAYEIAKDSYSIINLNIENIIPVLSDKLKTYNLYFKNFSRADYALIILAIKKYYENNNLDINIFNNGIYRPFYGKNSVNEIIKNRKLIKIKEEENK